MKNLGGIINPLDIATKEYVDSVAMTGLPDTGWIYLSLTSNFKTYDAGSASIDYRLKYRKIGNLVQITGAVSPVSTAVLAGGATVIVSTLPVGFRPTTEEVELNQGSIRNYFMCSVSPNTGNITVGRYRAGDSYPTSVALNTWIPINVMYFVGADSTVSYKSAITAYLGTSQKITAAATYTKINYDLQQKAGDKFTLYNGGIKVGTGVNKVKISSIVSFGSGLATGDAVYNYLYRGTSRFATLAWHLAGSGTTGVSLASNSIVLSVSAGQEFYIYTQNNKGARGSISDGFVNSLTIEEI